MDTIKRIMRCDVNNFYDVLGLKSNATEDEIKSRYKELALVIHPDKCKHKDSEEAFKRVNKANETLSDRSKRFEYNAKVCSSRTSGGRQRQRTRSQSYRQSSAQQTNGQHYGQHRQRDDNFFILFMNGLKKTLTNKTFLIVIGVIFFLFILLHSYEPKPYSLHRSPDYYNLRKTNSYNLKYFVGDDFEHRFTEREISKLESQIESNHLNDLKQSCLKERHNKDYIDLLKRAKKLKDKSLEEKAMKSKLPSCVLLQKLPNY